MITTLPRLDATLSGHGLALVPWSHTHSSMALLNWKEDPIPAPWACRRFQEISMPDGLPLCSSPDLIRFIAVRDFAPAGRQCAKVTPYPLS